jgi:diguanylate cyclase (GGDEF)-like protein
VQLFLNAFLPGGLTVIVLAVLIATPLATYLTHFTVDMAAAGIVIGTAALAWRFDRSRIVYTLLLLVFTDLADRHLPGTQRPLTTLLLAGNLLLVSGLIERGMHTMRGALLLALPGLQSVIASAFAAPIGLWLMPVLHWSPLPVISTGPHAALLLGIVAVLIQIGRFLRSPTPVEGSLIWALSACLAAGFLPIGLTTTLLRAGAALTLCVALIEMSYTLAYRDELTGLPGRRALMEHFRRLGNRYSIAMIDIDFFKKLNDRYGHDVGDQVLRMVAQRLRCCGGGGRTYRYGGEEFCVVFNRSDRTASQLHLEELRKAIADKPFMIRQKSRPKKKPKVPRKTDTGTALKVTVSIGVAESGAAGKTPEEVMKAADKALYRAKDGGRNQVCI